MEVGNELEDAWMDLSGRGFSGSRNGQQSHMACCRSGDRGYPQFSLQLVSDQDYSEVTPDFPRPAFL